FALSTWMATGWGGLTIGTLALAFIGFLLILGKPAIRVNTIMFCVGSIGLSVFVVLLLTTSHQQFVTAFNNYAEPFVGSSTYYSDVITQASQLGRPSTQFSWPQTFYAMPILFY